MKELKSIEVLIVINGQVLLRNVLEIAYRKEIWHGLFFQ